MSDLSGPRSERDTFIVVESMTSFSWGGTYRLRLERDASLSMKRLGFDGLGAPALQRRHFERPAGWETEVTILVPDLRPGDRIEVGELAEAAGLWSAWR